VSNWPLLSVLIWLPILGGALILAIRDAQTARWASLGVAVLTFAASLFLLSGYDVSNDALQFVETRAWIPAYDIGYNLGVDGIAIALILLTTLVSVLALIGAWSAIDKRVNQYVAAFLILEGVTVGIFAATDAMLIYLYLKGGSFQLADLYQLQLSAQEQTWIFFAFLIAFAVKVPMFPVHTWLPDAHVEAPTAGSVILAAIALKIGGYGFLRFNLPIVPDASQEWAWLVITLSLIAVIYVGLVALVQDDMKKLIAYSSIAHMGFVTLGTFIALWLVRDAGNPDAARLGLQGAMVQMISHGFVSGAMFSCVGVLYDRMHSRRIADYGGVVNVMPWFATFAMLFFMANAGLPGTSGFVGEFMIIMASFQRNPWLALAAASTLVITAAYTLWLYKRVFFGEVANAHVAELKDINGREWLVLGVFAVGTLALGLYPKPLTDLMEPSIAKLAMQIASSKLL
jgi:NADH-quinone oxidoreductase subunit M